MKPKKQKKQILSLRSSLFWDVDVKDIDSKKHAQYIIERILDFGLDKEVRWMLQKYSRRLLKKIVGKSRVLRPSTKSLWTLLLQRK